MGIFKKLSGSCDKRPEQSSPQQKQQTDKADRTTGISTVRPQTAQPTSKPICFGMDDATIAAQATDKKRTDSLDLKALAESTTINMNEDGSYIALDAEGNICKTCDVLGVKRDFSRDRFTGQLMVKRFGTWTKPERGEISADGTLFFVNDGIEIAERLNGIHIHFNRETGTRIETDHKNGIEIVHSASEEITKRENTKDGEAFWLWTKGVLTYQSETFYVPRRYEAETALGDQPLVYVSRIERRWSENTVREKFSFRNMQNDERHVTLSLQLGNRLLMLKGVAAVSTYYENDIPTESIYELKHPSSVRVDLPVHRGVLEQISQLRIFKQDGKLGLAFRNSMGKVQIMHTPFAVQGTAKVAGEQAATTEQNQAFHTADLLIR